MARYRMSKIRKRFNQTAIMRHLGAKCKKCGRQIPVVQLTVHHKNGKADDDNWENIVIYCISCHREIEGRDKKDSQRR